jgi:hypothetical protein
MSGDRFDVLDRFSPLFEAPEPPFEGFLRRRDRKRRNQRITAGAVGIAVFVAAIWIVTSAGPFHRTDTPATKGPVLVPPSPTGVSPYPESGRVGFIGLPPEGATPSTPKHGELVLSLYGRSTTDRGRTRIYVYADGRLIWDKEGDLPEGANEVTTGFLEQRLTPAGVELMRSEIVATGLFGHDLQLLSTHGVIWGDVRLREGDRLIDVSWSNPDIYPQDPGTDATPEQARALDRLDALLTHPESWLPASAWEDQEIRAYVPSGYAVCYSGNERPLEASVILPLLPPSVEGLLRGKDRTGYDVGPSYRIFCSDVTTEEARALVRTLDDAGLAPDDRSIENRLGYLAEAPSSLPTDVLIYLEPSLPDGEFLLCSPCG